MVLAVLAMVALWIVTGVALFAFKLDSVRGVPARNLRLLHVDLSAVAPVYGFAALMALLAVRLRRRPFTGAVMVTCAAAAGCAFVVPGFIAGKPRFIAGLVILETANPHERPAEQLKAHG
jgi:hypothetical protein